MARIWDKLLLVSANTTLKLHQKCDRIENEKKYIVEYYAKKKEEKLKRYALKANNTLGKIAYEICDKNEYADSVMGEKLQRYDVKKYLSHRRVNHEAAVAIFKAVKAGEKFDGVLLTLKEKNEQILAKRADYVAKLQAKRDAFVKSCALLFYPTYQTHCVPRCSHSSSTKSYSNSLHANRRPHCYSSCRRQ